MRQRHGDGCRVPVLHHLFINLKSFTYNTISEDADVFFSLYDTREAKQIRYGGGTPSTHTHTHSKAHCPNTRTLDTGYSLNTQTHIQVKYRTDTNRIERTG